MRSARSTETGSGWHVLTSAANGSHPRLHPRVCRTTKHQLTGQYWQPAPTIRSFATKCRGRKGGLRIYHPSGGQQRPSRHFRRIHRQHLPRIAAALQRGAAHAVAEHPTMPRSFTSASLFAVSSRFGSARAAQSPDRHRHGLGLLVLMDLGTSATRSKTRSRAESIRRLRNQYFHARRSAITPPGIPMLWDYAKFEVQRLLLFQRALLARRISLRRLALRTA